MPTELIIDAQTGDTTEASIEIPGHEWLNHVPADGGGFLVTYTNTHDDAPATVTFDVNGATVPVGLTEGVAELVVTLPPEGDVTVTVDRDTVAPVTIRGV